MFPPIRLYHPLFINVHVLHAFAIHLGVDIDAYLLMLNFFLAFQFQPASLHKHTHRTLSGHFFGRLLELVRLFRLGELLLVLFAFT